jgi:outer membrane murein-binding lipoprotein Lpp
MPKVPAHQQTTPRRRMEDHSFITRLRDNVIPPLLVAAILGGAAGGWAAYQKLDEVASRLPQINADIALLKSQQIQTQGDLTVLKSQMVGWDVLKRVELALAGLAQAGKGDKAMTAVSGALRAEIDARKEKP